ncbi:sugar phosphate isomerase/epimerase [Flammeovirga sp. MY04]|uniref:sugar phosphate isomerase/epimerase family protein n=1 Tax=Flammeovirga sp. MY04 TaxID=1191459 RepID=UPI0008060B89|nr:sugar phosphate isomerase/epimerase [Flammeovirga sp. MY04]ANQ51866.1 sugar phosphate isomerase/epimerase [Flammeovirga sp. MY04]
MQYSRRQIIKQLFTSFIGSTLIPQSIFSMDDYTKKYIDNIGLQLWTVRNELLKDEPKTLKSISDFGYQQLEGMNLPQVMSIKDQANDVDLEIRSTFFQWTYLTNNWELANTRGIQKIKGVSDVESLVELSHKLGLKNLTFGYLFPEERSVEDYKKWVDALHKMGEMCQQADITLSYHNHAFEFKGDQGTTPFQVLVDQLDPKLVKFELDVFWVKAAGLDPLKMMQQLDGRISHLHLKELKNTNYIQFDDQTMPHEQFVALGEGIIEFQSILKEASRQNIKSCFVEQDHAEAPLESIQKSINFLREIT